VQIINPWIMAIIVQLRSNLFMIQRLMHKVIPLSVLPMGTLQSHAHLSVLEICIQIMPKPSCWKKNRDTVKSQYTQQFKSVPSNSKVYPAIQKWKEELPPQSKDP
jgi:hypothetical protein